MAVTGVRVHLHNETDQHLTLVSSELPDGEWAAGPPGVIGARSTGYMRSESSGLDPDTEGRAVYQVGDAPSSTIYLHWNDPAVGSNSFHTNTDDGHYAFWTASGGRHPEVHFTLRPAGRVMTDFLPSRDGFRFSNHWPDPTPYSLPPLRDSILDNKYGNAKNGLCGGMVLAARDYFEAGMRIPATTQAPPGEQDPLFLYLVDRLFATFSVDSVTLLLALMNPLYPDGDENMMSELGLASGRAAVMAHEEWPLLRADIDAGHPSPLCIVTVKSAWPGDLGTNHQILAYGYTVHGHDVVLHAYDPNSPMLDDIQLAFNDGDVSQRIVVTHNVDVHDHDDGHLLPVYCFARMDYSFRSPTVDEGARLPGYEVDHRGISVAHDLETTSSQLVASGVRSYDVWPDCGEHEFPYRVYEQTERLVVTGRPHGYYDPQVVWRVGGTVVEPGTDAAVAVTVLPDDGGASPTATLQIRLVGDTLTVSTGPGSANFSLDVDVRVRGGEHDDASGPDRTWAFAPSFTGRREQVDGLAEAMADCMNNYLNARRDGLPDAEAAFRAARAQLRRPPDPLWDPDPVMVDATTALASSDPTVVDVAADVRTASSELDTFRVGLENAAAAAVAAHDEAVAAAAAAQAALAEAKAHEELAAAAKAKELKVAELTAAQLKEKITAQLGAFTQGGFH